MWQEIRQILRILFNKSPTATDEEIYRNKRNMSAYKDTTDLNPTAIFANALSVLAFGDSSVSITDANGDSTRRTELLDEIAQKHWKTIKQNIAVGNGCGMIAAIPYSVNNGLGRKVYIDVVSKDRMFVTSIQGDEITGITVLADHRQIGYKDYYRWTDYAVSNGIYTITQRATKDQTPCPLDAVPDWSNIDEIVKISGVDRLPIGIYKCPTSNRRPSTIDGVPITYGCEKTIQRIKDTLKQIDKEYSEKQSKIFADSTMFKGDDKINGSIFKVINSQKMGTGMPFFEIFSPEFRDTSLFHRLTENFAMLEREVGTSKGVVTDLGTNGATATEIKCATYQTFTLCDDIHTNTKAYFDGLMYGVNVLCNYYGLYPDSEYKINYDWSYAMLEDSEATYKQLAEGKSQGVVSPVELRQFIKPDETIDDAKAAIEDIRKNSPTMSMLIGD